MTCRNPKPEARSSACFGPVEHSAPLNEVDRLGGQRRQPLSGECWQRSPQGDPLDLRPGRCGSARLAIVLDIFRARGALGVHGWGRGREVGGEGRGGREGGRGEGRGGFEFD